MTTTSTLVWEDRDADFNGGEWPFPTEYSRYLIEGDLADRVRERTGLEGDVTSEEQNISGGYSEYTQENDYPFEIYVGGVQVFEYGGGYESFGQDVAYRGEPSPYGFGAFNAWLNGEEF